MRFIFFFFTFLAATVTTVRALDSASVSEYCNNLCSTALLQVAATVTASSSPTRILTSTTTLASALTSSTSVLELTATVETGSSEAPHTASKDSKKWLDNNWKYIAIPAGIVLVLVILFGVLAYFYSRHRRTRTRVQDRESSQSLNCLIPLQIIASASPKKSGSSVPWPGPAPTSAEHSSPTSLRAPPSRDPNFAARLKVFQDEIKTKDTLNMLRGHPAPSKSPGMSLEDTEALMLSRILEYGCPDLPISVTSKPGHP